MFAPALAQRAPACRRPVACLPHALDHGKQHPQRPQRFASVLSESEFGQGDTLSIHLIMPRYNIRCVAPWGGSGAVPEDMDDDGWLADSDDEQAVERPSESWQQLERRFATLGFKEGVPVGEEATLQGGFNRGFRTGSALGIDEGTLSGIIRCRIPAPARTSDHSLT